MNIPRNELYFFKNWIEKRNDRLKQVKIHCDEWKFFENNVIIIRCEAVAVYRLSYCILCDVKSFPIRNSFVHMLALQTRKSWIWIKIKFSSLKLSHTVLTYILATLHKCNFKEGIHSLYHLQKFCLRGERERIPIDIKVSLDSGNAMKKSGIIENEADESDSLSDDSNYHKPLRRRRSATVSPAAGTRFRHHSKSRFNFHYQYRRALLSGKSFSTHAILVMLKWSNNNNNSNWDYS